MSEFTAFCVGGKEDSCKKKVDDFKNIRILEDGARSEIRSESKKVYPSVYAVMSLLNIGRAICQGHFSIK